MNKAVLLIQRQEVSLLWLVLLQICLLLWLAFSSLTAEAVSSSSPTLSQMEQAALRQAPELKSLYARSQALQQMAVADNQWSDPKLMMGAMNVPVDTFNLGQEPMTQLQVGVMQSLPKGRSLHYRALEKQYLSRADYEKAQAMRAQILREVRLSWLQLYYWLQTKRIVFDQKKIFRHLVKVTESMLSNNQAQQKDVIRAQLELTDLNNQLIEITQQIETARAQLARWVGVSLSMRAEPKQLPRWKSPSSLAQLETIIQRHPILRTEQANIAASRANIQWAKQQYVPGLNVGAAYGFRQGYNTNGSRRADFLTAQVSMDLPLFTHNRQSRLLKASEEKWVANEANQISQYRQLRETLEMQYATWQQQRKSAWLYRQHLVPRAAQYAESTLMAYQNTQTDFPTLARAYVRALDTQLAGLKAGVNSEVARVNLLYLEGK